MIPCPSLENISGKGLGAFFDHIFSHSAVRSIWRQCIQRVTESKRIGADMAIKRKK